METPEQRSTGSEFCFVCDENIEDIGVCLSIEKTIVSKTPFSDKISSLIGETYLVIISDDDKLCLRCVSLINKFDQLETMLLEVRHAIVKFVTKKYNLDEEEADIQNEDFKETLLCDQEVGLTEPNSQIDDQMNSLKNTLSSVKNQEPFKNSENGFSDSKPSETEVAIKCEVCSSKKSIDCCQQKRRDTAQNTWEHSEQESNSIDQTIMLKEVKIEHSENDISFESSSCQQLNVEKFSVDRKDQEITKTEAQNSKETSCERTSSNLVNTLKPAKSGETNVIRKYTRTRKCFSRKLRPILPKIENVNDLANFVELNIEEKVECGEKKSLQRIRKVKLHDKKGLELIDNPKLRKKTCKICKTDFKNQEQLESHEKAHFNGVNSLCCSFCGKIFKTFSGVRDHTVHRHTKKFAFYCDFCGRGFTTRARLEDHRSGHTQESRWVCDVCGKRFNHQSTYWIHKKWHTEPLPYQCDSCGRKFKHTSLLAVHRRSHTGERPYKCSYCSLTFTSSSSCKRHLILHTRKYPFHCAACRVGFTARYKYTAHLAKTHGNVVKPADDKRDFKMAVREAESQLVQDDLSSSTGSVYRLPYLEDSSQNNSEHFSDEVVEIVVSPPKLKSVLHDRLISQVWLE